MTRQEEKWARPPVRRGGHPRVKSREVGNGKERAPAGAVQRAGRALKVDRAPISCPRNAPLPIASDASGEWPEIGYRLDDRFSR